MYLTWNRQIIFDIINVFLGELVISNEPHAFLQRGSSENTNQTWNKFNYTHNHNQTQKKKKKSHAFMHDEDSIELNYWHSLFLMFASFPVCISHDELILIRQHRSHHRVRGPAYALTRFFSSWTYSLPLLPLCSTN